MEATDLDERLEELQAVGVGVHDDADVGAVGRGGLEGVHAGVEALGGELIAEGALHKGDEGGDQSGASMTTISHADSLGSVSYLEHDLRAISGHEGVLGGVEGQVTSDGKGGDELGGGDEAVGGGVAVVTGSEVAVEGGHDAVGLALGDVGTLPLANAGAAGVGEDGAANLRRRKRGVEHRWSTTILPVQQQQLHLEGRGGTRGD